MITDNNLPKAPFKQKTVVVLEGLQNALKLKLMKYATAIHTGVLIFLVFEDGTSLNASSFFLPQSLKLRIGPFWRRWFPLQ